MYTRILVPLDGSSFAEAALPRALSLGARWRAEVQLASVSDGDGGGEAVSLESTLERIRSAGFSGSVTIVLLPGGEVVPRLVEHVRDADVDFVVMTTHGRGPVRRAWLGSAADGFLRRTAVPVLLVRPAEEGAPPDQGATAGGLTSLPGPFRRIVLPLDGSPDAERLIEITAPLVATDAEILLLRAVPAFVPGGSPYVPHVVRGTEDQTKVAAAAQEYLDGLAARVPVGRAVTRVAAIGQPALAVLQVADEMGADLIAMSTAGRGGVSRMLLGSVADKVIRGSKVPVLVHRHGGGE
jgi:nucleotide-binding universal stress UspA family protein